MPTRLTFTIPVELVIEVPSTPDDDAQVFDRDVGAAYDAVRGVLSTLRSDRDDVAVYVEHADLPDPTETPVTE
ncbi:MAG: hypothetical protein AAGC63_06230 [Propionicimonas sp.]